MSFRQLKDYIEKKQRDKQKANMLIATNRNINERQAQIIQFFAEHPNSVVTVKEMQSRLFVTLVTARKDLLDLVDKGYLVEFAINKVKMGYVKSENFDDLINNSALANK